MSKETHQPNAERIENILQTSEFFRVANTRRKFVQHILTASGGLALGGMRE